MPHTYKAESKRAKLAYSQQKKGGFNFSPVSQSDTDRSCASVSSCMQRGGSCFMTASYGFLYLVYY